MNPPDIIDLNDQLDKSWQDAQNLAAGLTQDCGTWRPHANAWSVAQCLDHLARTDGIYLQAMQKAGSQARAEGRLRQSPAVPGFLGRWFAKAMEPPARAPFKMKAPGTIQPDQATSLTGAFEHFQVAHKQVTLFLNGHSDLDLASIRFPNPFIPGLRFTLATGLHVITAHERRHLWQAWRARRAAEDAVT